MGYSSEREYFNFENAKLGKNDVREPKAESNVCNNNYSSLLVRNVLHIACATWSAEAIGAIFNREAIEACSLFSISLRPPCIESLVIVSDS